MKKLYVIGNGFDKYHELDTSYQSFGFFLKEKYPNIYENLIEYYGFSELIEGNINNFDEQLWSDFEIALADIDCEIVLDNNSDYLANLSSSEFRDRDWHSFSITMEQIVEDLTTNLLKAFKEFILSVNYPASIGSKKLSLDKNDFYLTFNYTDTLEKYYGIPSNSILYIHGKACVDEDTLILGHGIDPEKFETKPPEPPKDINDEELEKWCEFMSDQYDYSYESGKDELMKYFIKSFKETEKIIDENESFFQRICEVSSVIVLGHSLSEVDEKYFIKILRSIKDSSNWTVTYNRRNKKDIYKLRLLNIGVSEDKINVVKMNEFQ